MYDKSCKIFQSFFSKTIKQCESKLVDLKVPRYAWTLYQVIVSPEAGGQPAYCTNDKCQVNKYFGELAPDSTGKRTSLKTMEKWHFMELRLLAHLGNKTKDISRKHLIQQTMLAKIHQFERGVEPMRQASNRGSKGGSKRKGYRQPHKLVMEIFCRDMPQKNHSIGFRSFLAYLKRKKENDILSYTKSHHADKLSEIHQFLDSVQFLDDSSLQYRLNRKTKFLSTKQIREDLSRVKAGVLRQNGVPA